MILRTRKSVFMWKTKFNGRKNSAPSRPCAATWIILMSPAQAIRPIPAPPTTFLPSPKLSLIFGPWEKTEFYVQGGFQFSQQRRARRDADPGTNLGGQSLRRRDRENSRLDPNQGRGNRRAHADRSRNFKARFRSGICTAIPNCCRTATPAAPPLHNNRATATASNGRNYYALTKHLAFDFDAADSIARFTSVDADDAAPGSPGGDHVPEAVGLVISSGITLHDWHGFSSSLRLRYFGPRDLTSDGLYKSSETILLNAEAGYQINKTWRISAEFLNLLDRRDHDIDYAYTSRVTPAAAAGISRGLSSS